MLKLKCSRQVAAPPARVFQLATDLRNAPGRVKAIKKMEVLTDGPIGKGTRFRETRVMFGKEATEVMEIVTFDPPRGYVVEATSHGCHYRTEFRVTPAGEGTEFEMLFEGRPLTFMARVMGTLMKPLSRMMVKQCLKDLDDIADAAENPT
ncbi:MAG: SRPBCC family protein [Planctomycetes bacterium]|nr:SRPBCC family protein [Planctomycetota bacterium]